MKRVVHRKGIVKRVTQIAGRLGRSWFPQKGRRVWLAAERPAMSQAKSA